MLHLSIGDPSLLRQHLGNHTVGYCASYFVSFMNKCVNLSCHQVLEYLLYCIVQFVHVATIEFQLRSFQKLYSRFYPQEGEEYKEEVVDDLFLLQ